MSSPSAVDTLYRPLRTPIHALDPAVKLACLFGFVVAVVATPPRATWAFAVYGLIVASTAHLARIPIGTLGRRMLIEVPFVLFALALPFIGSGPDTEVAGFQLSEPGLWAAFGIIVKGALGAAACVVLAWSTPVAGLLGGLERLRVPRVLTAIAGFMVRYLDVVASELRRLQIARVSRGDDPRWLGQARALGATIGTLFVRSFERGERVQHAMLARGFDGQFPSDRDDTVVRTWWPSAAWPGTAIAIAAIAIVLAP
jgi:cobalt/nickel transport system permease protein